MKIIVALLVVLNGWLVAFADIHIAPQHKVVHTKEIPLTGDYKALLQKIATYKKDLKLPATVKEYFYLAEDSKTEILVLVEGVYEKGKNEALLFGEFVSYGVAINPTTNVVSYSSDEGTSARTQGMAMVSGNDVVISEMFCGRDSCATTVKVNEKVLMDS